MQQIRIHRPRVRRERPGMRSSRPTRGTPMWSGPRRSPVPEIASAEEQPGSHVPPARRYGGLTGSYGSPGEGPRSMHPYLLLKMARTCAGQYGNTARLGPAATAR